MMDTREVIVVGIDGSSASSAALRWALREAVTRDAAVEVVHCYLPQTLTDIVFGTPHELHTASAIMIDNEVSAALREMPQSPEVRKCCDPRGPAKALVEKSVTASLLVLGVHGRTALRDRILGQVGRACLRNASCTVVTVASDNSVVRHETSLTVPAPAR